MNAGLTALTDFQTPSFLYLSPACLSSSLINSSKTAPLSPAFLFREGTIERKSVMGRNLLSAKNCIPIIITPSQRFHLWILQFFLLEIIISLMSRSLSMKIFTFFRTSRNFLFEYPVFIKYLSIFISPQRPFGIAQPLASILVALAGEAQSYVNSIIEDTKKPPRQYVCVVGAICSY